MRYNSFLSNHGTGLAIDAAATPDLEPSILGTLAECNLVRDTRTAYCSAPASDAILWRRNYACFWNLVGAPEQPLIAFRVDRPEATFAIEENAIEGSDKPTGQKIIQLRTPEDNA